MTVVLRTKIRQRPPDHRGGYELDTAEISAEGDTYDQALEKLRAQVPDDWQMLGIGRD